MNRRQKALLKDVIIAAVVTIAAVVAMINFRDWVNRSEATRAMEQLGRIVSSYRQQHNIIPPESYVDQLREDLQGSARLGELNYRARWIDFDAAGDEILAYTEKTYGHLTFSHGFIVLRLDGRVEWLAKEDFEDIIARQRSTEEIQMLGN
ncbi:MAG: hypothetical protein ACYSRZ_05530 [Planctomycetota bacterium]|jgi:hypothetical protein